MARGDQDGELRVPPLDLPAVASLPADLAHDAARLRAEADLHVAHRFDLLGSGLVSLGEIIDWHRDFKSGYRWPPHFYQDVAVIRLDDASDAKVPWELSRGHHLLTLARAARIFEDRRYLDEFEQQLDSWLTQNPPGFGINWTNPMEVAIRAVNWVWAIRTIEAWAPVEPTLRRRLATALQIHARHIAWNLEGTPLLRSNHYLSDILGLLVLGAVLGNDPFTHKIFERAHESFETEIHEQVHDDGIDFEASLPYHGLVLEIFLLAREVATWRERPFSNAYDRQLEKMLAASLSIRQPGGRIPQIGDGDSGRILPGGFDRPPTHDHLLWLGAATVGTDPGSGKPSPEVAWTLGMQAWNKVARQGRPAHSMPRADFAKGGFFVLRGEGVHVVARCGDVGQNGNGGHAHNDLLSFELCYDQPLLVDPGTYSYSGDPGARNVFRSTRYHNTVVVDDTEINPFPDVELFTLRQVADCKVEKWEEDSEKVTLVVSHDGYQRLASPVTHSRTFVLERESGVLSIRDELAGSGSQRAKAFLHLAPGLSVSPIDTRTYAVAGLSRPVLLGFSGPVVLSVDEGWVSERYGVRAPAQILVASVSGELPLQFGLTISHERPLAGQNTVANRSVAV